MANVITTAQTHGATTTGLTSADISAQNAVVITAYDRMAYFQLRPNAVFNNMFTVKAGHLTSPGTPVKFRFHNDIDAQTDKLLEAVDVDSVGIGGSFVTVTPHEYGMAVTRTLRLITDVFLLDYDSDIANLVGYNLTHTIETLARTAADAAGTQLIQGSQTTVNGLDGDTGSHRMQTDRLRDVYAKLATDSVMPFGNGMYALVVHPLVYKDLIGDYTDTNRSYMAAALRQDMAGLRSNMMGSWGGFMIVQSPRALKKQNTANRDYFLSYACGQQALARVDSILPRMRIGPVVDKLMRFYHIGWHCYMGWGEFRSKAMYRIASAASGADNT